MRISTSYNSSLKARGALANTSAAIARSLERLTTGRRVNSSKDDPAAFALGVNLESQIRGIRQGIKNVNAGLSLIDTASSALSSQMELVQRMREIAVEASSGTLSTSDRNSLDVELQSLVEEFGRISSSTALGELHLLDGSFGSKIIQLGYDADDQLDLEIDSSEVEEMFRKTIGTGTFQPYSTFASAGSSSYSSEAHDFDGDGHLDLISSDYGGSTFSILKGKGDGTFLSPTTVVTGVSSYSARVSDLNDDGLLDVVTANVSDNTVSIHLGNGDGTFKPRSTVAVGQAASDVGFGDFNDDGDVDLAVSDSSSGTMSILLGNGDGSFQTRTTLLTGTFPYGSVIADLNEDGNDDIVVSNLGSATVSIFYGNGNGTFQSQTTIAVGQNPYMVKSGDLNGDGNLDLVSADSSGDTLSILLGNGNGTFKARTTISASSGVQGLIIEDVNGDDIEDLIVGDPSFSTVSIYIGNGNGTFQTRTAVSVQGSPAHISVGDFNGDGVSDFVVSDYGSDKLSILTGRTQDVGAESDLRVTTQEKAEKLIVILDDALDRLLTNSASLSALHSRLDSVASSQLLLSESVEDAKSLALDADIALETAELVRHQILQQAQVAVFGQANSQAQLVMSLLADL